MKPKEFKTHMQKISKNVLVKKQIIISNMIIFSLILIQVLSLVMIFSKDFIQSLLSFRLLNIENSLSYITNLVFLVLIIHIYLIRNQSYFNIILLKYILYICIHLVIIFIIVNLFKLSYNVFNGFEKFIVILPFLFIVYLYKVFSNTYRKHG